MLESKIKKLKQLKKAVLGLKRAGKRIIFTNGCFDILHFGHAKYLQEAKKFGDILIVGVNSDSSVKKIKGRLRPLTKESDRMKTVAALESVDYVVAFSEDTPLQTIILLEPDILVKGSDWKKQDIAGADFIESRGGKVKTVRLSPGRSTSGIIKKIAKRF